MKPKLLIIDDDPGVRFGFTKYLSATGYEVVAAQCLAEAQDHLNTQRFDTVLLDLNLPDGSGLKWIDALRANQPDIAIVVITGLADIPTAVEAMRKGADNFLTKPVNMEELDIFLKKGLEVETLRRKSRMLDRLVTRDQPFFGESRPSMEVVELANLAARTDSAVVLQGETGTGKGVLARWIHEHGKKSDTPFVEVNCSSLKGDLLASELFGHVRGAFTSAIQDRQGLVEVADGGTLFLDEIGDMDLSVQAHLLKVIEDKQYRRLGEVKVRRSDFRLICATNRNLLKDVQEGRFRQDLYFRIFVFPIVVPPLRTRSEDLAGFVSYFLSQMNAPISALPLPVMDLFKSYPWPGNIRELRNVLERALLLSRGAPLTVEHFFGLQNHVKNHTLWEEREASQAAGENNQVLDTLKSFQGNVEEAAKALGMSRATFYRRLKKARAEKDSLPV